MEDYTYHLDPKGPKVLGAHMLEVCPSLADGKPSLEMHPLGIGGKDDPARLVFNAAKGAALNATIIDMGTRFRMVVNEVDVVAPDAPLPKLPVARALWVPRPDLKVAAARVDPGRRGAPFGLQLRGECAAPRGLCRHGGHRVRADRREDRPRPVQEGAALERRVLAPGRRGVAVVTVLRVAQGVEVLLHRRVSALRQAERGGSHEKGFSVFSSR